MDIIAKLLFVLAAYALMIIPGLIVLYISWKLTQKSTQTIKTAIRSLFIAAAFTPAIYGHAGILPAAFVIFMPESNYSKPALLSLAVVWVVVWVVMFYKHSKSIKNESTT